MTIKKTIHELMKENPDKSYREMEKYRDADRQEEAQRIITQQENEELKEDQLTQVDLDYHQSLKDAAEASKLAWEKEHKLRQEAEGELTILKGIETNRVKEAQTRSDYLQSELDRIKRENNDLHNKVAALLDAVDPVERARKSGL